MDMAWCASEKLKGNEIGRMHGGLTDRLGIKMTKRGSPCFDSL